MFYNVGKDKKDGRESRLSGRESRLSSERDGWTSARRSPNSFRDGFTEKTEEGLEEEDYYEVDEEHENFVHVPKCMLGKPLKDFDSGQQNTFVVVQNKFGRQSVYRFCTERALFLFGTENRLRRVNVFIVTHHYFELFILLTIVTNCVFMALSDAPKISEFVFAGIYTFEMVVKVLSKGFILHKYSYLRNAWNWLDFSVVMLGYIEMAPGVESLSAFRTFRVLRALKTISTVKGLKAMVNTLMKSMKMMTDVLILTLFFIAIFALIGLQMFLGKLRSRCVRHNTNHSIFTDNAYRSNSDNWYTFENKFVLCGNASTSWTCPTNFTCVEGVGTNPQYGYISYDNFLYAFLTTLQVCTLDFWESVYNNVISAMGEYYMVYFLLAVFLGPFYLLNLVLAVVSASYEGEINGNPDPELEAEKALNIRRSASTYSFDGRSVVEYLHGTSPVVEIDGQKQYTVPSEPPVKKSKAEKPAEEEIRPPELGENPSIGLRLRVMMSVVVGSSFFEGFITACIMMNTVVMALEYHGMSKDFLRWLEYFNYIFTAIFFIEMICKLIALTPRGYSKNRWNLFDGTLVTVSLADLVLSQTKVLSGSSLSVLRVFRLMRVLKLAQSWKTMGQLLSTIASSIGALGNITVILGIIIYIFAVVGMQLFGNSYTQDKFPKGIPRYNFNNFGNSFMMIFRILCGKWIEPQWDLLVATNPASIAFMFTVFVIGRWVVLNLFLALLLSSFGGDALSNGNAEEGPGEKKPTRFRRLLEWTKRKRKRSTMSDDKSNDQTAPSYASAEQLTTVMSANPDAFAQNGKLPMAGKDKASIDLTQFNDANGYRNGHGLTTGAHNGHGSTVAKLSDNPTSLYPPSVAKHDSSNSIIASTKNGDVASERRYSTSIDTELAMPTNTEDGFSVDNNVKDYSRGHSSSSVKIEIHREKTYVDDCFCGWCYTCAFCFTSYLESPPRRLWHNIRYVCKSMVENKYFEFGILFLIGFSSLTLIFEDVHLDNRPILKEFLTYCNYFFAITFTLEFLVKLVGFGCVKYFTNLWNLLDVFIVAISLASLFGNKNLKALRSLRALRPLRAISRFEGMKVVVNALVHSIPSIANVLMVCFVFWLIFSIMGYQLFGGRFFKCVDSDGNRLSTSIVNHKSECNETKGYRWVNSKINFDNAINGFLALFQTATLEGWFEAMADGIDARNIDEQPKYMNNYYAQLYFVVFIVLGAFFILNLFIGVIIDNFNRLKQQYEDGVGIFLTAGQRNWINTLKSAAMKKPTRRLTRPISKWRAWLFDFVHTKYFEFFIMSVILANMLTMMINHYQQPDEVGFALKYLNFLFTGIFTIEALLRLVALRLEYFKSGMNVFDFIVVVFSIAVIIMEEQNKPFFISPGLFRVVRVFRLGRLLRFFDGAKGIRQLLFTIVKSAPALVNIGTLLFLVMFIYAIMGMNLFPRIKKHGALTETVNFETFGSSMCLLFRISTAAGWNGVLDAAMLSEPDCNPNEFGDSGNCGQPLLAIAYFVSYIILMVLIIINMYIAVILENFNQAQSQDEAGITEDDLEAFYASWEAYDPKATQYIKYHQLNDFIDSLEGPLRVPKPNYWFLEGSAIAIKEKNRVHCLDIMTALIKRAIGEVDGGESEDFKSVMAKVEDRFRATFPSRSKETTKQTTEERLRLENAAARKIQRVFRRHLLLAQMHLLSNNTGLTMRARERSAEQVEQLVTVIWRIKEDDIEQNGDEDDEDDESDMEEAGHDSGVATATTNITTVPTDSKENSSTV